MSWTFTTSGAATIKAGENVDTTILANETALNKFSDQAEGTIIAMTRRDWLTGYANLASGVKYCLDDAASSYIAIQMINTNMSGFTSRQESQTMLDVNDNTFERCVSVLKDFKSNDLKTP